MKKLSWFNKFMFFLNIVLAVLTVVAYVFPFLAPKLFPLFSVLTLILPLFLIFNGLFFIYWGILLKKQIILSALILLAGITFINKFYKFSGATSPEEEGDFKIMSYNVRLFNLFSWLPDTNVPAEIQAFINEQNPDILCIQEFSTSGKVDLKVYPHRYIMTQGNKIKTGQGIFSKFPIINEGQLTLPHSNNNLVFADIRKGVDTIRVYSMHLQSVMITPDIDEINQDKIDKMDQKKSVAILRRLSEAFTRQQQQAEILVAHIKACNYPIIICGDMNNSAFSYVYRNIKGNLQDSFETAGTGFGQTYNFKYYPARIDYIFVDPKLKIKDFSSFSTLNLSDHFPIMTRLSMKNQ